MNDDLTLIREYARNQSERAFAEIVSRHINLVHSVALRQVGDAHLAADITQAVFIILARKADSLGPKTILAGWLCRTAWYASANALKMQRRRQLREQEAYMQSTLNETGAAEVWPQIAPLLDGAMQELGRKDHDALVMRFFENRNFKEVGAALGSSEDAAKMRVGRALEKLRKFFTKRGVVSTVGVIAGAMSAHSVQAAPAVLAKSVTAVAVTKGAAAGGSTLVLLKGALKLMAWAKAKTAIFVGTGVLVAAGTTTLTVKEIELLAGYQWEVQSPDYKVLQAAPPMLKILPTKFPNPPTSTVGVSTGRDVMRMGIGLTVENLCDYAYDSWSPARRIVTTEWPPGRYDFIDSLRTEPTKALQEAIRARFHIVARREMVETNVLLLVMEDTNAPGLKPYVNGQQSNNSQESTDSAGYTGTGVQLSGLGSFVEGKLLVPVVDQTGLTNRFDINLRWHWDTGGSEKDSLTRVLRDELGLALVATNMPIEMLVVGRAQ